MALLPLFRKLFAIDAPPASGAEILFFGLGNPGSSYARMRHNAGFRIADALVKRSGDWTKGRFAGAAYARGKLFEANKQALVVKPLTFVNRSGVAVKKYVDRYRNPLSSILVILDDYNLPLGKLRIRRGGSDGGHNGLKSIIAAIGDDFPRLRIGIGPLPAGQPSIDFVLGLFTEAEERELEAVIPRAVDACAAFARTGIEEVMNTYNR